MCWPSTHRLMIATPSNDRQDSGIEVTHYNTNIVPDTGNLPASWVPPQNGVFPRPSPLPVTRAEATPNTAASIDQNVLTRDISQDAFQRWRSRFSDLEFLEEGGCGHVKLVHDNITGKAVVVKTYAEDQRVKVENKVKYGRRLDWRDNRLLMDQCFLDRCLPSPHIVHLIETYPPQINLDADPWRFDDLGKKHMVFIPDVALVLEYMDQGDLFQFINTAYKRNVLIPEVLIWHWLLQMAKALKFIHHELGDDAIIHNDIKPENWLLATPSFSSAIYPTHGTGAQLPAYAFPDIKLADFDLARYADNEAMAWSPEEVRGTPEWQPQEYPRDSKASDIWATGACIYYMCMQVLPIRNVYEKEQELEGNTSGFSRWAVNAPRQVGDVKKNGYSHGLQFMLERAILNLRPGRRIGAKDLVDLVESEIDSEWAGKAEEWHRERKAEDMNRKGKRRQSSRQHDVEEMAKNLGSKLEVQDD